MLDMLNIDINQTLTILFRITLAVLLAFIPGIERELTGKFAGLRTHILVCLGSGSSRGRSKFPPAPPAPEPAPLSCERMFSSSMPSVAFLRSLAAFVASSSPVAISPALDAALSMLE